MQEIICQRILLTFPQRIEYQLVRKQFSSLDLKSSILSSESLKKLDTLMANDPHIERKQTELITKRTLYEDTIKELQNLGTTLNVFSLSVCFSCYCILYFSSV